MESNSTLCDFVKSPTITLTVNQEPREDDKPIVYKEGTNLELGCEVVGGVPERVDGFFWMIHSQPLNYTLQLMHYRVDDASMKNGAHILCKEEEGTDRTMNCSAVNEEQLKVGTSEDKKASVLKYKMDIKDDKKLVTCIVNNQAFGGDFNNSSFIPQKVGANYKDGTGHHSSVNYNLLSYLTSLFSGKRELSSG